jgi:hypothetical protein
MTAPERGDISYQGVTSTMGLPGGERLAKFLHPETKKPIAGGNLIDYMRGKDVR